MPLTKKQLLVRDAKCNIAAELLLSVRQMNAGSGRSVPRIETSAPGEPTTACASSRPFPRVVIFAGPNGAGKSTHADAIVAALGIDTFVNADYIARGLSGRNTDAVAMQAGRIMLTRLKELAAAKQDFAFESTLSSRSFAPFLRQLKTQGYQVAIYYFSLASASLAVRRVKLRVAMGGHDVSEDTVRRRYGRSVSNFLTLYLPLTDDWTVYDNSTAKQAKMIASFANGILNVLEPTPWLKLQKQAKAD
jgi:predicted ABC-type ATPase